MTIDVNRYSELRVETEDGRVVAKVSDTGAEVLEPAEGYVLVLRPVGA